MIERLDTVILEIRHFQQNIIYLLHTPELYLALNFEERFLWCDMGWEDPLPYNNSLDQIVDDWIIMFKGLQRYNSTMVDNRDASDYMRLDDKLRIERENILDTINNSVSEHVNLGHWNNDQRAHYHNLRILQQLKQNVFRDKLEICAFATEKFIPFLNLPKINNAFDNSDNFSRFLILRNVVLARLREYVSRLGDQQTVFSHSQDFGLHDHPRPNINRRRDQHLFNVYLADRCRDINREMVLLLADVPY